MAIRLPKQWSAHVKSGVLHAISLASVVLSYARGRAVGRPRLRAQLEEATAEISLLREELDIKDGRWERSRSRRRPHYTPVQRMRILQVRAARDWTLEKTAKASSFAEPPDAICQQTIGASATRYVLLDTPRTVHSGNRGMLHHALAAVDVANVLRRHA